MEQLGTEIGISNSSELSYQFDSLGLDSLTVAFNNSSVNSSHSHDDARDSALAVVEVVVLAVVLLVAVVGNVFVLMALWRHSMFRPMSRCYLFMLHLSLADLLVAVLNIFPQLVWDITYRFHGSDVLCRLVKYGQVFVLYLSTYILVFMAVDRARAVQGSGRGSFRTAKFMIAGAWTLGLVLAVPQAVLFGVQEVAPGVSDCWVEFRLLSERAYVTWFVASVFLVPLAIIALCYGYICWAVWSGYGGTCTPLANLRRKIGDRCCCCCCCRLKDPVARHAGNRLLELERLPRGAGGHTRPYTHPVARVSAAKMKTVRMTFTVVVAFTLCWVPFCVAQMYFVFRKPDDPSSLHPVVVVCMLLGSLNSCTNPWIYLCFSGTLLNQLRVALGLGPSRPGDNVSIGDQEPRMHRQEPRKHPITQSKMF